MKTHFHMKGYALRLALKKRYKTTRKWPISRRFGCDVCCLSPQVATNLNHVSSMFETCATSRLQIALKSQLVYTRDFISLARTRENCTEKCDKNCAKNRMCKPALTGYGSSQRCSFSFIWPLESFPRLICLSLFHYTMTSKMVWTREYQLFV